MADRTPSPAPRADGLERLIEAERRLDARLADAHAEARAIREDAARRAAGLAGLDEDELDAALAELARRIADQRETERAAVLADAERERAAYDDLDRDRLEATAEELLRRLRGDPPRSP